jgi:thioredoxin reductase (NADPH)
MRLITQEVIETDIVIIGAGPVGLFAVFEAGLLDLECHLIDSLDKIGGQCIELYPDKPIYDIPGVPNQTAREHVDALLKQIKPFNPIFHLHETVTTLLQDRSEGGIRDSKFTLSTNGNKKFITSNVIIAGGAGTFKPKKPDIKGLEEFEGKGLEYAVRDKSKYFNKRVLIFGGGDSALDWAVELADIATEITVIHRSKRYKASPHTVKKMRAKSNVKEVTGKLERLENPKRYLDYAIVTVDKELQIMPCDEVLIFFGLNTNLDEIRSWRLELDDFKRKIKVNTKTFETNMKGVFAIGDMCCYPGKLDLILSGFHEGTLAVQEAFYRARPGEQLVFQYTTTSSSLKKKLS